MGGELGNESELEKNGEPESGSEDEKADESGEDVETITERGVESEDVAEEEERAGMMADAEAGDESDTEPENDTDLPDGTVKITDISMYTEEEFRDICERVDVRNPFGDRAQDYLVECRYKVEAAAAGAALFYIDEFLDNI